MRAPLAVETCHARRGLQMSIGVLGRLCGIFDIFPNGFNKGPYILKCFKGF